jgi:hypothetical protein
MGPQVVRVFSIENLFKEIGDYGMFVLCCVFGALLSERSPHLKRQVNIVEGIGPFPTMHYRE